MHIVTINRYKIAIFWSTRTGYSTMYKILKDNFPPNSKNGWKTHTQNIPDNIKDFTFILIYRNPIERAVSSFFMPQVPDDITFKNFILNFNNFEDHHQMPQTTGPGFKIFKHYNQKYNKKFDYMINNKNLDELSVLIEKLTGKNIEKNIRENVIVRTNEVLDIKYFDVKGLDFSSKREDGRVFQKGKIPVPGWKNFYDQELETIARRKLKSDYDFFESIGIKF